MKFIVFPILFVLFVSCFVTNPPAQAQSIKGPVGEILQIRRDYVTDKPFQYQPSDPWTRSIVYRIHTGHYGKYHDCDGEEQKRNSPYICWKTHFENDIVPHRSIREKLHETVGEVRQRIADGSCASDCNSCNQGCTEGCSGGCAAGSTKNSCGVIGKRLTGSNVSTGTRRQAVSFRPNVNSCGTNNCSGSCGNTSCRQKAELARRLAAATRSTGSRVLSTGKAVTSRVSNIRLFGNDCCPTGNCAPVKTQKGCQSDCGCSSCATINEGPSGLLGSYNAPQQLSVQPDSTARGVAEQPGRARLIQQQMAEVRAKSNAYRNLSSTLAQSIQPTQPPGTDSTVFAKAPCACAKCQSEPSTTANHESAPVKSPPQERTASQNLLDRIRAKNHR